MSFIWNGISGCAIFTRNTLRQHVLMYNLIARKHLIFILKCDLNMIKSF